MDQLQNIYGLVIGFVALTGIEQLGAWIEGKEYIFLPLVLLLLAKGLIDSRHQTATRTSN